MKNNTRLRVTENLLTVERGSTELLLANYLDLRPLYIRKGRKYIKHFLNATSELGTHDKIIDAFPNEASLLEMLIDHAIIIPGDSPQDNTLQMPREELNFDSRKGISLYLLISQSCNMGCIYCLNGTNTYQSNKRLMMSEEVAFKSLERCLESICPQGYLEVIFFGGEPLLNWPLAKDIILYCENSLKENHAGKQIKYHFTSNLSFVPADLIEWATRYNITFLCDVDGPRHIHNRCRPFKNGSPSYDIIIRNIDRLVRAGLPVMLRTTVTSVNQDHLLEATRLHKTIGGKTSAFVPVNPFNSDEDILPERLLATPHKIIDGITEVYRSTLWSEPEVYPFNTYASRLMPGARTVHGCGAPYGNTPVVTANGDVYPCIYLVGIKRFYMGNIVNESYPDKVLLQRMYTCLHVDNRDDCRSCSWRYICSGACPLARLLLLDNPVAPERVRHYCEFIQCEYTRYIFELILWRRGQEAAAGFLERHKACEKSGMSDTLLC